MSDMIYIRIGELVPLFSSLLVFLYGLIKFFKKGKALYLKIITMAMGCYAISCLYHICQIMVIGEITEGFTPAYLGRMGFFLFIFTANFGQMDGLLDDKSKKMRASRFIGLIGPVVAIILLILCLKIEMPRDTKIAFTLVWIPAIMAMYFNLKHAVIPDLGYGFVKAVRPYNISAFILSLIDLLILYSWANYDEKNGLFFIAFLSVLFGITSIVMILSLEKGVNKWKI